MENLDSKSLRKIYPQKYCLKMLCTYLYLFGCMDFWYEPRKRSLLEKKLYPIWVFIANCYLIIVIFDEYMAYTRTDLLEKEKNDLVQHTLAHSWIMSKILVLYFYKNRIKMVLKRFLEEARSRYSSKAVDEAAMSKAVKFCGVLTFISVGALISAELDGIRVHIKEGIPIRTEVTYYPTRAHSGLFVNILRFFTDFHWYFLVTIMILVDSLTICCLVFVEAKFKLLQLYFKDLGNILKDKSRSKKESQEEFKNRFIEGIRLHEDALWSATNIQNALGTIYSVQIFESLSLLVMCLIKLVANDRTLMLLIANLIYITCIIILTGIIMISAGDITYEASMLSTAMFHCGWELYDKKSEIRPLAVMAIQRSHVPVYMTAFGIIKLSYVNFISVLRSSYSFFAVMY